MILFSYRQFPQGYFPLVWRFQAREPIERLAKINEEHVIEMNKNSSQYLPFRRSNLGMNIKTSSPPSHKPRLGAYRTRASSRLLNDVGKKAVIMFEYFVVAS